MVSELCYVFFFLIGLMISILWIASKLQNLTILLGIFLKIENRHIDLGHQARQLYFNSAALDETLALLKIPEY